ncbi:MAG TPA: glycerol-3-phosphate dehydrogenase/oxidase [Saprospiraceae bacterium]|nr:glycerol-3-phosphate dehydrogenase/oxidase [Saprospiraceae bacterium]
MERQSIIHEVKKKDIFDIVVIGGGASGLGTALDAVSRGLSVLLVEKYDFGKGTSSKATKLLHGGVRYLAQGDISLVIEALHERKTILKNAPHLARTQEFIIPFYDRWQGYYYLMGLKFYDLLSFKSSLGDSKMLSKKETLALLPNLKKEGLKGGISYFDGQFDDARLCIDLVHTIIQAGGFCLNYTSFEGYHVDESGISNIHLTDHLTGQDYTIQTKCIVNAAGVHADDIIDKSGVEKNFSITPAKGSHLIIDKKFLSSDVAIMIPKTSDGRVLFIIPWHGVSIIGTTDIATKDKSFDPVVSDEEITFMLHNAAAYFENAPTVNDIISKYSGLRPLVSSMEDQENSKDISRKHKIVKSKSGFYSLLGGKWTTFRKMGQDTIDFLIKDLQWSAKKSNSENLPIIPPLNKNLGKPLHNLLPYSSDFFDYAIENELVESVEDLLARRTRCLFINKNATLEIADEMINRIAIIKNKDVTWKINQKNQFLHLANSY